MHQSWVTFKSEGVWLKLLFESNRFKIDSKTIDSIFVGYFLDSNTYQFLIFYFKFSNISINTIIESRDVIFFGNIFSFQELNP